MRIRKAYFTLAELASDWGLSLQDMGYLAENDELRLAIRVYDAEIVTAEGRRVAGDAAGVAVRRYNGLLGLRPADAHALFRNGDTLINQFLEPGSGAALQLVETAFVLLGDVVVTQDQRECVERKHPGLSNRQVVPRIDFATFSWEGKVFRFSR